LEQRRSSGMAISDQLRLVGGEREVLEHLHALTHPWKE
jgi:hypothetical protein